MFAIATLSPPLRLLAWIQTGMAAVKTANLFPMKAAFPHVAITALLFGFASAAIASGDHSPDDTYTKLHPAARSVKSAAPVHAEWMQQAIGLERQGDWQRLMELGWQWTRAEPGNATAWFILGRALSATNRYQEAIAAYRKLLKIDPRDVYARNNLGNAYRDTRHPLLAMHTYCDVVRIDPDYMPAWKNLGITFFQLKGMAGVAQALQQLGASDPELADAWYRLAIGYSQTQDEQIAQQAAKVLRGLSKHRRERMFNILFSSVGPTIGAQRNMRFS
jgi:tetratricopeptide (TPR) repeat protein